MFYTLYFNIIAQSTLEQYVQEEEGEEGGGEEEKKERQRERKNERERERRRRVEKKKKESWSREKNVITCCRGFVSFLKFGACFLLPNHSTKKPLPEYI